jgi:hypothetical protein
MNAMKSGMNHWMGVLFWGLLTLGPVLLPLAGTAQLHAGIGLQAGFNSMPNANVPIDRFNGRAFLYKPMNKFHWPMGEVYEVSIRPGRALLGLNLNTRRQRATAKSTSSSGIDQRDVRFSMQALSVRGGYAVVDQETFALYLCSAVDAGYMRLLTRTGPANQINRVNYYLFRREPMLAGSIFAKFVFRSSRDAISSVSLSPYLHIPFRTFDFIYLDQLLNQGTLPANTGPLPARPLNIGVAFNFDLEVLNFLEN